MTATRIPRPALILGWAGVIPFAAFAFSVVTGSTLVPTSAANALVLYGAVILSFMGGAQWGLAITEAAPASRSLWSALSISVLPALAAFAFAFLPSSQALLGLAAAFAALLAYDIATARSGMAPAWYPALRSQLTLAVITCLLLPPAIAFR